MRVIYSDTFAQKAALGASLVGVVLSLLATIGASASAGPGAGLRTMLLLGPPWFLGLVPVLLHTPRWMTRLLWAVVVIWGGVLAWLTLVGGMGFLILPLTLLYGALLASTWVLPPSQ